MPNGCRKPSRSTKCSSAAPSPSLSRKSEMRLAFSTIAPDRRCTMFWMMARGDQEGAGSVAASATSTSPLGKTCNQRGCLSPRAKAPTSREAAALGAWPSRQGSLATDQLTVGNQLCFGGGIAGCSPYPVGTCCAFTCMAKLAANTPSTAADTVALDIAQPSIRAGTCSLGAMFREPRDGFRI